jgi:hypothetical protein
MLGGGGGGVLTLIVNWFFFPVHSNGHVSFVGRSRRLFASNILYFKPRKSVILIYFVCA